MRTNKKGMNCLSLVVMAKLLLCASAQRAQADGANSITQINLVSDIAGMAKTTDPDLANPWGVSFSDASPFWVSDNGTGLVTLYNGAGVKQGLVVTVPPPGDAAPTGQVFNGNSAN